MRTIITQEPASADSKPLGRDRLSSSDSPKVTIVVLNYKDAPATLRCVDSLGQSDYSHFEITVVDNASRDESVQRIRAAYPNLKIIENSRNLGYAGGNNVGIKEALRQGSDYVLILNNDTRVDPTTLSELVTYMESDMNAGAAGPRIVLASNPSRDQHLRYRGISQPVKECLLNGAAVLVRRSALLQTGLMDENYFIYWEETDWWRRMHANGFDTVYVPTSGRVIHEVSSTMRRMPNRSAYLMVRNEFLYRRRFDPPLRGLARALWNSAYSIPATRQNLVSRVLGIVHGVGLWMRNPPVLAR